MILSELFVCSLVKKFTFLLRDGLNILSSTPPRHLNVIKCPGFRFWEIRSLGKDSVWFTPIIIEIRSFWVPCEPPLTVVIAPSRVCFVSGSMKQSIPSRNKIASRANRLSGDSAITFYFTQRRAAVTSHIQRYVIAVMSAIQFANYPTPPSSPLWDMNIVTLIHLYCACLVMSVLSVRTQGEFLRQGLTLWRHKIKNRCAAARFGYVTEWQHWNKVNYAINSRVSNTRNVPLYETFYSSASCYIFTLKICLN